MSGTSTRALLMVVAGSALLSPALAQAAPSTWSATAASNDFFSTGNWTNGVPGVAAGGLNNNADVATFLTSSQTSISLGTTNWNLDAIDFGDNLGASSAFTINGGTVTLSPGAFIRLHELSAAVQTIASDLALVGTSTTAGGAGVTLGNDGGASSLLVLNGNITGTGATGVTNTIRSDSGVNNPVEFGGVISDSPNGGKTTVLKTANNGAWTILQANTYSGGTTLGSGGLIVGVYGTLGAGDVTINRGTLTLNNVSAIDDLAKLSLDNVGNNDKVDLNFTGTDVIGSFFWGGVDQGFGTFGHSSASPSKLLGDSTTNDTYFLTGPGLLQVVPEPAAMGLLGLSLPALLLRRRASEGLQHNRLLRG